jgi:hypothetical protein
MKEIYKLKSKIYKKYDARYIKISKNQMRILESLYVDGSNDKKYYDSKNKLRYSEHSGLLDFGKSTLQRFIINAKQNISDKYDDNILLPDNMPDAFDFEYMFHTHPSTPKPGSRVSEGFLYEFPSISDFEHFIDHHNFGKIQGSMIIAPEGLYIIKCIDPTKKVKINEREFENYLYEEIEKIQNDAIKKYKNKLHKFNEIIANDKTYVDRLNLLIKDFNLKVFYKPRIKVNNKWILDDLYLKVKPVE